MSSGPTRPKMPIASSITAQEAVIHKSVFDCLPDSAYIRESQLVQSSKKPDTTAPLPFSSPTLWRKVKNKTFPAPVKLSERVTAWNVGHVRTWMLAQATASELFLPGCCQRPQQIKQLHTETTPKERLPGSPNSLVGPTDSQSVPNAAGAGDNFDSKHACIEAKEGATALKAAANNVNWLLQVKGSQVASFRKKLTDALEAIDRMEADSAKAEQNSDATKSLIQAGGADHVL